MTRERAAELLSEVTVLDDPEMAEAHRVEISALRQQDHFREVTKKMDPMTNADRIRSMTDEELVNVVPCPLGFSIFRCPIERQCGPCKREWLKQPVVEGAI